MENITRTITRNTKAIIISLAIMSALGFATAIGVLASQKSQAEYLNQNLQTQTLSWKLETIKEKARILEKSNEEIKAENERLVKLYEEQEVVLSGLYEDSRKIQDLLGKSY